MKRFLSPLLVVLVATAGVAVVAGATPADSAGVAVRAKKFDPKTFGAKNYPSGDVYRATSPYRTTWCNGGIPGLRIEVLKRGRVLFISYTQLAKNYASPALARSADPAMKSRHRQLAKRYRSWAAKTSKQFEACKSASGSGSGSASGTVTNPYSADRAVRWVPFTRSRTACASASAPSSNELRFALCGKEGIAKTGSARSGRFSLRSGSSDVKTFDSAGSFTDAVSEGSIGVGTIAVGPTGWTYMGLSNPVNLSDTSSSSGTLCAFVRIREATGVPSCVDEAVRSVSEIQFDNAGRVYYRGTYGSSNVLRRYWDGVVTDLITSSASLRSYVALEDGTVVLSGSSSGTDWVRWLTTSLELKTIANCYTNWLRQFPDGNVYFGTNGGNSCVNGTQRFLGSEKQLDPVPWIRNAVTLPTGTSVRPTYANNPAYFHTWRTRFWPGTEVVPVSGCDTDAVPEYCYVSTMSNFVVTQSGSVFALAGNTNRRLLKMWPDVSPATTSVTRVTRMREAGNSFAITGTNSSGQNITTVYDPATDTERTLISPSTEVEVYNLAYSSSTGELFFDGLRFSNNTYVVGKVNVSTGAITYLGTTLTSFSDFQAF